MQGAPDTAAHFERVDLMRIESITEESAAYATPKAAEAPPSPLQKGRGLGRGVARGRLSRGLGSNYWFSDEEEENGQVTCPVCGEPRGPSYADNASNHRKQIAA